MTEDTDLILLTLKKGVRTITFNRPQRKNAMSMEVYIKLTETLNQDARNDAVWVTILTGSGDFYSSGNDIKSIFERVTNGDDEPLPTQYIRDLVVALIDYPKLLIAVLNGPAIGIAATSALLCDAIYASDRAYFQTPFIRLGLVPEGCSSRVFVEAMGRSRASQLLLMGEKLSAQDALIAGVVAKVVPHNEIGRLIEELHGLRALSRDGIVKNKRLMIDNKRKELHEANDREMQELTEALASDEFLDGVMKFMESSQKSKL